MKKLFLSLTIIFCFSITTVFSQVEVKGTDSTSATMTWFTSNAKTSPDTTMVVLDDGNVGIGTTTPSKKLEVNGIVYSTNGGVQFPDGSIQTSAYTGPYKNVFTVSPSGGDFPTISMALSACVTPSPTNTYLIRVMPGIYPEPGGVNCLPYVHLKGAGKYTTVISGGPVFCADNSTLEGFKIEQGVQCMGVSPTIIHNIIMNINETGHGIEIGSGGEGNAKPWIIENEIMDCYGWGIYNHDSGSDPWILGNKIFRNSLGGVLADGTSPIINNNYFINNNHYAIKLVGFEFEPPNPVVTDNVIDTTDYSSAGIGILMESDMEASIIGNNIHHCEWGIWINDSAQPSIISNNISYNYEAGIVCNSDGYSKPVVIKSNHIHSNVNIGASSQMTGIYILSSSPIITHNNIHNNPLPQGPGSDIDYSSCAGTDAPMISLNVFDVIIKNGPPSTATGLYNVTSIGGNITP